jgi:hypothetical protein
MELWPHSTIRLGFLRIFGPVSGWAETLLVVIATAVYAVRARASDTYGRHWLAVCGLMAVFWGMGHLAG